MAGTSPKAISTLDRSYSSTNPHLPPLRFFHSLVAADIVLEGLDLRLQALIGGLQLVDAVLQLVRGNIRTSHEGVR